MPTFLTANALNGVSDTLTDVMGWVGTIITSLVSTDGALKDLWPFILVGFSVSIILLGMKILRSFSWGI